jgi:hypothetical protein
MKLEVSMTGNDSITYFDVLGTSDMIIEEILENVRSSSHHEPQDDWVNVSIDIDAVRESIEATLVKQVMVHAEESDFDLDISDISFDYRPHSIFLQAQVSFDTDSLTVQLDREPGGILRINHNWAVSFVRRVLTSQFEDDTLAHLEDTNEAFHEAATVTWDYDTIAFDTDFSVEQVRRAFGNVDPMIPGAIDYALSILH